MNASEAEIQGGIGYGLDQYPNDYHHHMDLDLWSNHNTSHIYENPNRPEFSPREMEHLKVEQKRYPYMATMPDILDPEDGFYNNKNVINPKSHAVIDYMNRNTEHMHADRKMKKQNKKAWKAQLYASPSFIGAGASMINVNNNMILLILVFIIVLSLIYVQYAQSKKINKLLRELATKSAKVV